MSLKVSEKRQILLMLLWTLVYSGLATPRHYTVSTKKQSQGIFRIFSVILTRTDENFFYNIWRTYSSVHSGHNCSCISNEASVIPLPET